MDRLVKPDVKEAELAFKKGQKCSTTFRLNNLMHTMSVAVCLTTSNPSIFSISQPISIIPPLSSASYTVVISQPSDQPPLSTPPDMITVRSAMLPVGKAHPDDLRRLFSKPGPHIFRDANILISFVGPQVIEFLVSHHNNVPELSFLLNKAISGCTKSQLTKLLTPSISSGKSNIVSALIDAGADVNVKDSHSRSLLSVAVRSGNIDVVKVLIAAGCELDQLVDRVLHIAAAMDRVDLIQVIRSSFKHIDMNSVDSDGRTPIHVAAICGHVKVIQFFVSVGGDPELTDLNKWTPLHCAAAEGHLEAVEYLLDCSGVKYAVNNEGKTAFALAADNEHSHLFNLLHLGDVLQKAARFDDVHGIQSCLAKGAKVNGRDQNGWTALHGAAFKGRIESVKILLEYGAQVDANDDAGYTPLHCAVEAGHVQVALLLVAHGAKANMKSLKGLVPLNSDRFKNHTSIFAPLCYQKQRD